MKVNKSNLQDRKEIKSYLTQEQKGLLIKSHSQVKEYRMAFDTAMTINELSKKFPLEETDSLTSPILCSSRSVCINLAIAYQQKDINPTIFLAKMNDCSLEIIETQTWIQFAVKSGYIDAKIGQQLDGVYHQISNSLVKLLTSHGFFFSSDWSLD